MDCAELHFLSNDEFVAVTQPWLPKITLSHEISELGYKKAEDAALYSDERLQFVREV